MNRETMVGRKMCNSMLLPALGPVLCENTEISRFVCGSVVVSVLVSMS